jgi:hypothetical protein
MSIFDAGNLALPAGPFSSRERAYKRRAYGSVTNNGNDQFNCGGGATLTFGSGSAGTKKYAQGGGLQSRGGGRYVPNSHLTSITTKNQGGGDLSDVTLWQIEFQYTCYSKAQLDLMAKSFMIPKNLINVTLGYDPGGSVTISNAQIHDFSWNYNSDDATWTCTAKALGENSQVISAGAFTIKPNDVGIEVSDDENGVKSYSVVKVLQTQVDKALGIKRSAEGDLTGANIPTTDGRAKSIGSNAIVKLQIEASGWSMFISAGKADDKIVTMTTIQSVIDFFNAKLPSSVKAKGGYKFSGGKYDARPLLRSADPAAFCLPGALGTYGEDNDFKDLQGTAGDIGSVFVSTDLLLKVEADLLNEQSKKTSTSAYTISQFLSKMFGELAQCTGNAIDCFITERDGAFYIVNRTFDIKKGSIGTSVELFSSNSSVKSCNMSSNFDPEMAAIAFAGASGKFPEGMASGIFAGCTPKDVTTSSAGDGPDVKVQAKIDEMGKAYKAETVSDFKTVLKQYVMSSVKDASFRYGIDLSLTLDGAPGVRFMQKFTVNPLPGHISSGTYFVVGEIEHKCDGETWDTTLTGYMMVNV